MKRLFFTATIILTFFSAGYMPAAEAPSVALVEKLFNGSALAGTANSKSGNSCHPGGGIGGCRN